jgi:Integrase zinc binding domain/RNase H-like domain found in reverse transcriptase
MKGPIPTIVTKISKKINNIPGQAEWGSDLESTIVYVEQVIGYWSRTFKSAERNYSTTEREALGVKEGLIKFQAIIKGEKIICITDHVALQWARTYENVNRQLASWGAIYGSYPGLEIVHRAGRIHSNVDALSRLRRSLTHQSPLDPETVSLEGKFLQQIPQTWESITEQIPSEKIALISTRSRTRQMEERQSETQTKADPRTLVGLSAREEEEDLVEAEIKELRNPPSKDHQPGRLLVAISQEHLKCFVLGYQSDMVQWPHWNEALDTDSPLIAKRRYYKDPSGLLFFRDADWVEKLCVPKPEVHQLLKDSHESASKTAHAGAARLYLRLRARFYWPCMWSNVRSFCETCDVCQKRQSGTPPPFTHSFTALRCCHIGFDNRATTF